MEGIFASDCQSSSLAWFDPGCLVGNAGEVVGGAVTSALEPVWIILAIAFIFLLVLAFAPNVKHIVPHLGFG